jgi:hypothetical protein
MFLIDGETPENYCRLSYLHCYDYQEFISDTGEKTKNWSVSAILPPTHPAIPKLVVMMKEVAIAKWKDKGAEIYAMLKAQDKLCIHDGNNKISAGDKEAYHGNWFVTCNGKVPPTIINRNQGVLVAGDRIPYSGCYGNIEIEVWAQDNPGNKGGKRINAGLLGVQFWRHGDSFGGANRVSDASEFPCAEDADDAPPEQAAASKRDPLE